VPADLSVGACSSISIYVDMILMMDRVVLCFMLRPGLVPGSTVKREHPIHTIQLVPNTNDQLFICTNSGYAYITTISGQLVKVFTAGTLRALSITDMQCSAVM